MEVLAAKRQHSAALVDEAAGKRQRACCDAPGYLHNLAMDCSLPTQGPWSLSHGCDYNDSDVDEDDIGGASAACNFLWSAPTAGATKLQPAAERHLPDLRPSHCGTELHFTLPTHAYGLGWDGAPSIPSVEEQLTPPVTSRAPATAAHGAACSSQMQAKQNPFEWTADSPLPSSAAAQQHLHNLLGCASPAPHAAHPPAILTTAAAADSQQFLYESYPSTPTGAGIPSRRSPPPAPLRRGAKAFLLQDDIPSAGASSYISNLLDDDWFGVGAAQPGMRNSGSGCGLAWLDGGGSMAPRARSLSRSSSSESLSSGSGGSIMSAVMAALPRGPAPMPDRTSMPPPPPVSRRLFNDSFLNDVQSVHAPRPTPPPGISPWLYNMLRPAELQQEQQALLNQQGAVTEQQ